MTPQILLVDDNQIQAATRSAILSRAGLRVAVAQGAEEALMLLDRSDIRAALRLLVTDHLMPGMNGPELVRRLRVMLPTLPVLVLSGLADAEKEYEGMAISFKLKPLPPDELIQIASLMIDGMILRSA